MSEVPFWTQDIYYLTNEVNFFPCSKCSMTKNLNRITRFVLISSILLAYVVKTTRPLYLGLFLITSIAVLYFLSPKQMNINNYENFGNYEYGSSGAVETPFIKQNYEVPAGSPFFYGKQESLLNKPNNSTTVHNQYQPMTSYKLPSPYQTPMLNYGIGPQAARVTANVLNAPNFGAFFKDPVLRAPTKDNPFMNVMPLDYDAVPVFQDYNRYEKVSYPTPKSQEIRNEVKSEFEKGLYKNAAGKLWDRENSQREFVSQPVGSVPSDQAEFAQWLYGNTGTCKQGSVYDRYGLKYTDDSLLCNGFNVASPTNQGLLNGGLMSSVDKSPGLYK